MRCRQDCRRTPFYRGEYDPLFFHPGLGKTFAEADMAEKSAVSHRGRALAEFAAEFPKAAKWLEQRLAEVKPPKPDHRRHPPFP